MSVAHAQAYARIGWHVLPLQPGQKVPLKGQGLHHATRDPQRIAAWFRDCPGAGIGIALEPSGLAAVDIDPRNGGDLELRDRLPATLTAATGGGGLHLVYRVPPGATVPGQLQRGVDLKHKGYIVVEPSLHPSGKAYSWLDYEPLEGEIPDIADAPPELLRVETRQRDDAEHGDDAQAFAEGGRNAALTRQAGKLRRAGLSADAIAAALQQVNAERCRPPLPEDEVRAIAASVGRYAPAPEAEAPGQGAALTDFYAHMPSHQYLFVPTRELWPASSVNGRLPWPKVDDKAVAPASWLDKHRAVEQMAWHPAEPQIITGRVLQVSGWVRHEGASVFNLYRAPERPRGDARQAGPWLEHVRRIYPDDAAHILAWLAHRVQQPGDKCNHALVLGGLQGIGKDTLLEPLKAAVGPWNWQDISPAQMLGRFNGWAKAVVLRISEARDLGDVDRFAFYDHSKTIIAAPPDVLRVDEKHLRETYVANVCGVVITTNHLGDGLYLPADDRRHYVAWSQCRREDFGDDYWRDLYAWFAAGGIGHVCTYLTERDIGGFDPKAPPPKTSAFWTIVAAGDAPEAGELRDVIDALEKPQALTVLRLADKADHMALHGLVEELRDRKQRRSLPHKLERVGYVPVRNPDADDGLFSINGRRQVVYALRSMTVAEQVRAARRIS